MGDPVSPYVTKAAASTRTEADVMRGRCPKCMGKGKVFRQVGVWPREYDVKIICSACHGTGVKTKETRGD